MDIEHRVCLSVHLTPIWHSDPPQIVIGIDQTQSVSLESPKRFDFDFRASTPKTLRIELINKTDKDTVADLGLDKAVVIDSIEFFGISDPRFIWAGTYRPRYPRPWYDQQDPKPQEILTSQDRLSWNGPWELQFGVPVFTWIHEILNLGWIYD